MPSPQALTKGQAQRFQQATALLRAGQKAAALAVAQGLIREVPTAADAWQLMAICLDERGDALQSDAAFERALQLAPGNAMVSRTYGTCLARRGHALRMAGEFDLARSILRKAVDLAPALGAAWVDLAAVCRSAGRIEEALAAFRRAEQIVDPCSTVALDIRNAICGVLAEAGRPSEALASARGLLALHPAYAPGHETLSTLLWEHGTELAPGEDPLGHFRAVAQARPGDRPMQLAYARMLLSTKRPDEALAVIEALRSRDPGHAVLDWFAADALDALGECEQASLLYAGAARSHLGELPDFLNARARHAFRIKDVDLATECAAKAVQLDPVDQEAWSHLGTAWRLAGDEREYWLCDYERLVRYVEIAPPPGYDDLSTFLDALKEMLGELHNATREPVNQSVRGGTQTPGHLFGRGDRVLREAEVALRATVEDWLATLPVSADHPFLARKQPGIRFVGSWSVRLKASGRHSNHIHPKGWMSSAFHVSLPGSAVGSGSQAEGGWLQFGMPLEDLGLGLCPRRVIQPKPGHVALFPSYMWHGTVPFEAPEDRLTIAFDMQPLRTGR